MSVLSDIAEAFDEHQCSGLTIWVDQNNHIQASLRAKDGVSWSIGVQKEVAPAIEQALEKFFATNPPGKIRKPVDLEKRRRELDDLV